VHSTSESTSGLSFNFFTPENNKRVYLNNITGNYTTTTPSFEDSLIRSFPSLSRPLLDDSSENNLLASINTPHKINYSPIRSDDVENKKNNNTPLKSGDNINIANNNAINCTENHDNNNIIIPLEKENIYTNAVFFFFFSF
jgi:hypothetical protein